MLFLPQQTITTDHAGNQLVLTSTPPAYIPGPYTSPVPHYTVPSLVSLCILSLLPYPDQIHLLPATLNLRSTASLQSFLPPLDPRLWAILVQVYNKLPSQFRVYTAPLSDVHVPLLQRVQCTDRFALVTVLELSRCQHLTDETIHGLRELHTLTAFDASENRALSAYAVKSLGATLQSTDGTPKGPWHLRILSLRNCRRVTNVVYEHLEVFPLLSVVDLRGTQCSKHLSSLFKPCSSDYETLYHPSTLLSSLSALETLQPALHSCASASQAYILHLNTLYHKPTHPTTQPKPKPAPGSTQDSYVVLPPPDRGGKITGGHSDTLLKREKAREDAQRHEKNKEAWMQKNVDGDTWGVERQRKMDMEAYKHMSSQRALKRPTKPLRASNTNANASGLTRTTHPHPKLQPKSKFGHLHQPHASSSSSSHTRRPLSQATATSSRADTTSDHTLLSRVIGTSQSGSRTELLSAMQPNTAFPKSDSDALRTRFCSDSNSHLYSNSNSLSSMVLDDTTTRTRTNIEDGTRLRTTPTLTSTRGPALASGAGSSRTGSTPVTSVTPDSDAGLQHGRTSAVPGQGLTSPFNTGVAPIGATIVDRPVAMASLGRKRKRAQEERSGLSIVSANSSKRKEGESARLGSDLNPATPRPARPAFPPRRHELLNPGPSASNLPSSSARSTKSSKKINHIKDPLPSLTGAESTVSSELSTSTTSRLENLVDNSEDIPKFELKLPQNPSLSGVPEFESASRLLARERQGASLYTNATAVGNVPDQNTITTPGRPFVTLFPASSSSSSSNNNNNNINEEEDDGYSSSNSLNPENDDGYDRQGGYADPDDAYGPDCNSDCSIPEHEHEREWFDGVEEVDFGEDEEDEDEEGGDEEHEENPSVSRFYAPLSSSRHSRSYIPSILPSSMCSMTKPQKTTPSNEMSHLQLFRPPPPFSHLASHVEWLNKSEEERRKEREERKSGGLGNVGVVKRRRIDDHQTPSEHLEEGERPRLSLSLSLEMLSGRAADINITPKSGSEFTPGVFKPDRKPITSFSSNLPSSSTSAAKPNLKPTLKSRNPFRKPTSAKADPFSKFSLPSSTPSASTTSRGESSSSFSLSELKTPSIPSTPSTHPPPPILTSSSLSDIRAKQEVRQRPDQPSVSKMTRLVKSLSTPSFTFDKSNSDMPPPPAPTRKRPSNPAPPVSTSTVSGRTTPRARSTTLVGNSRPNTSARSDFELEISTTTPTVAHQSSRSSPSRPLKRASTSHLASELSSKESPTINPNVKLVPISSFKIPVLSDEMKKEARARDRASAGSDDEGGLTWMKKKTRLSPDTVERRKSTGSVLIPSSKTTSSTPASKKSGSTSKPSSLKKTPTSASTSKKLKGAFDWKGWAQKPS